MRMKDRSRTEGLKIASGALMAFVAVALIFSFAPSASAAMGNLASLSGKVISVDPIAGTLTIKTRSSDAMSPDSITFSTDKMTSVTSCAQNKSLRDVGVGEDVTVRYRDEGGKLFADTIEKKLTLALACIYP